MHFIWQHIATTCSLDLDYCCCCFHYQCHCCFWYIIVTLNSIILAEKNLPFHTYQHNVPLRRNLQTDWGEEELFSWSEEYQVLVFYCIMENCVANYVYCYLPSCCLVCLVCPETEVLYVLCIMMRDIMILKVHQATCTTPIYIWIILTLCYKMHANLVIY